jgi:Rad3-related DNA helicase
MDVEPIGFSLLASDKAADWSEWQLWAAANLPTAVKRVEVLGADIKSRRESGNTIPGALSHTYRTSKSIAGRLESISTAHGLWVIQSTRSGYKFTPRWVAGYGSSLFGAVPKVLLMSAILTPKTADSLGVPPEPENRTWIDVPSYFPPENTPIWHVPTVRVNYRTDDYGTSIWLARIDQIISRRLDRKGIIFTVSYDRAYLLLRNSRYNDIMVSHSTADVVQVVNRFKDMPAPAILVSPSVTTGYDFPGLDYIIAGKVPYPDTQDPVIRARHEDDKEWTAFLAMGVLIQELGRGTRSADDQCECLIVDDTFRWWWPAFRKYAPKWFCDRVKGSLTCVPDPLVRLR